MEAMDQLLLACHAQTLNLFVESFLKMVQKLLETTEAELQILATQSVMIVLFEVRVTNLYILFFSLLNLLISRKIPPRIIDDMIFSLVSFQRCVTVVKGKKLGIKFE